MCWRSFVIFDFFGKIRSSLIRWWQTLESYKSLHAEDDSISARQNFRNLTSHSRQRTIFADLHFLAPVCTKEKFENMERSDRNPNPFRVINRAPRSIYRPNFIEIGVYHLNMFPRESLAVVVVDRILSARRGETNEHASRHSLLPFVLFQICKCKSRSLVVLFMILSSEETRHFLDDSHLPPSIPFLVLSRLTTVQSVDHKHGHANGHKIQ